MSYAKNRKAFLSNPCHLLRSSLTFPSASWLGIKVEYIQCTLGTHFREALTGSSSFKSMSLVKSESAHRTTIKVGTSKEQEGAGGSRREQRASRKWLRGSTGEQRASKGEQRGSIGEQKGSMGEAQREHGGAPMEHRGSTTGSAGPIGYGVFT